MAHRNYSGGVPVLQRQGGRQALRKIRAESRKHKRNKEEIIIAHQTQITGAISELTAAKALMEGLGWEVAKPLVPEVYDYLARDPLNGKAYRVQVKTLRIRTDRDNALVVYARKGNGKPYTRDETDYIVGVDQGRAFMFECTGLSEYWSTEQSAKKRWIELTAVNEEEAV